MSARKRAVQIAWVVTAGMVLAWPVWKWWRGHRASAALGDVVRGQDMSEVEKRLGPPDWVVEPGPSHWCDREGIAREHASEADRDCSLQWIYKEWPFPACVSICFGTDRRVASTYRYVSP